MAPQRFVTEYPPRCGQLLEMSEQPDRQNDLIGSVRLHVASAPFTIPFARMTQKRHSTGKPEAGRYAAVEALKKVPFLGASILDDERPGLCRWIGWQTFPPETTFSEAAE